MNKPYSPVESKQVAELQARNQSVALFKKMNFTSASYNILSPVIPRAKKPEIVRSENWYQNRTEQLLANADIAVGGNRPWDLQVKDERLFRRIWAEGTLGLGEAYMDGWWECAQLDDFFYRAIMAKLENYVRTWRSYWAILVAKFFNLQKSSRAFRIGRLHYDIGNDLYKCMLDPLLIYSCAYWKNADSLEAAQIGKLDLIARKLKLKPGMRVLDIGCGWGGAAKYMAEHHGVEVVGVTVSTEQAKVARARCANLPVEIRLQDYREVTERFDRIYSIGMFEHVGTKNYRTYARLVRRCLADDGISLIHTIGNLQSSSTIDPWIAKYVFPNSILPSIEQICAAVKNLFIIEDLHNIGVHYDKTLVAWHANFEHAWNTLKNNFDERFHRMWRYYLLSCAGAFRARDMQVWQVVLSPLGVTGGYDRVR